MEYLIGLVIGCIVTNILFWLRQRKAVTGTFQITNANNESVIGMSFDGQITSDTDTIILTTQSRK